MPRIVNYKPGSIIYFTGDKARSVFLLKQGKVNLVYNDTETGEEITDLIKNGEFFGVKSGLILYPREETAKVLVDSQVLEFNSDEFENLVMKNTTIILKMLRSFSSQLRRVGKQVQSLVSNKISSDVGTDLFLIGDYYLKNKKYTQAITVYKRYLEYYSDGELNTLANKRIKMTEEALDSYGEGGGPTPMINDITKDT